ncbi:MAG TPA: helix-turn-helix domain-containing protein, partial [Fimbriimonas sp.]
MNRSSLIVHPVRSRIITGLIGRSLTTRQLARLLPEVPVPSLYRHLRTLAECGVLEVVEEIPVRGTLEKVYAMAEGGGKLPESEIDRFTGSERQEMLDNFLRMLSVSYRAYVESGGDEPVRASATALYLTDEEERELRRSIAALMARYEGRPRSEAQRRRMAGYIVQPDMDIESEDT